jgi:hypothetical protein
VHLAGGLHGSSISGSTKNQEPLFLGSSWHHTTSSSAGIFARRAASGSPGRVDLLDADDLRVGDAGGIARLDQVEGDLAAAQDHALGVRPPGHWGPTGCAEVPSWNSSAFDLARVAQQALGAMMISGLRKAVHLAAQHVEVVGRAGDVADLHVVFRAQLQVAFQTGRRVLRTLAS